MESKTEIWKSHPDITGIEVSTFGNVRTLDRLVSSEKYTRFFKGRVLKPVSNGRGYMQVHIKVDSKRTMKYVHRLVARTFIPNPDSLPEINHKDNNPLNNGVLNLEWCTRKYNVAYREKYGIPAKDFRKSPVYAINLKTQETLWFSSQKEAGRKLGVDKRSISKVIKGKLKTTGGFWFTNDDENAVDIINRKLNEIGKMRLMINMEGGH